MEQTKTYIIKLDEKSLRKFIEWSNDVKFENTEWKEYLKLKENYQIFR